MPQKLLTNQCDFDSLFGVDETPMAFTTNIVQTTIVTGLTATKTADKECWCDGPLTYEVRVTNTTGDVLTGIEMTDFLDPAIVTLDTTFGVLVDGVAAASYDYTAGTLTVPLDPLPDLGEHVVSFRVTQV